MIKTLSILTAAAMLICGGVGVANANSDAASLTAVPDAVIDFEDAIFAEPTFVKELDLAELGAGGVTMSADASAALTAVEGVTSDFENVVPGELIVVEGITPTVIAEQGVTAAK